jgi:hypothetical protein
VRRRHLRHTRSICRSIRNQSVASGATKEAPNLAPSGSSAEECQSKGEHHSRYPNGSGHFNAISFRTCERQRPERGRIPPNVAFVLMVTGAFAVWNVGIAFVVGVAAYGLNKKGFLRI